MEDKSDHRDAVVVGVDGSRHAGRALTWAARQAQLERRTLVVVHATQGDDTDWLPLQPQGRHLVDRARSEAAQAVVDHALDQVQGAHPELGVRGVVVDGDPRTALVDASGSAHLVVVGRRGRSPWKSLLMGSVSTAVSRLGSCPVLVVGEAPPESLERVVVGADGTAGSVPVVRHAFQQASLHAVPLTVRHCYWDIAGELAHGSVVGPDEGGVEDLRALVSESVAGFSEEFPDVTVELELARGLVDLALTSSTSPDSLLVVGHRAPASWGHRLYASVAVAVLDRARGPVVVVPQARPQA